MMLKNIVIRIRRSGVVFCAFPFVVRWDEN